MSDAQIGSVKSVLDVDTRSGEASLRRAGDAYKTLGDAAGQAGEKVEQSGQKVDRAAKLKEQAIDRARRAFEREKLAQNRAMDAEKEAIRQKELAALKADILSRSVEKEAAAHERLARTKELFKGALEFVGITATVGFAVEKMTELVKSTVEMGVELGHLSKQTGMSVETLSVLKYAAQTTGIEFESLTKGFKKLSTEVYQADGGSKEAVKAFTALGISQAELKAKGNDLYAVLALISDRFKEMPDGIEKNALASQLFGKAGQQLIPILNQGAEAIERMKASAPIFTDADVETMEKLHRAAINLEVSWHRVGLSLVEAFGPAATNYLNNFAGGIEAIAGWAKEAVNWLGRIRVGDVGQPHFYLAPPAAGGGGESHPPGPPSAVPPAGGGSGAPAGGRAGGMTINTSELYNQQIAWQTKNAEDNKAFYAKLDAIAASWKPEDFAQVLSNTTASQIEPAWNERPWNLDVPPMQEKQVGAATSALDQLSASFTDVSALIHDTVINTFNEFNDTVARAITGERGASFGQMARGMGTSLTRSGLQMFEGTALKAFGFGKRDGSTRESAIFTIPVTGMPGTAVPGVSSALGKVGSWLSGMLPHFADGGPVAANMPILVGENGPEPFIPQTPGWIVPHGQMGKMGGNTWVIDARGTDPALTRSNFERALAMTHNQAVTNAAVAMADAQRRRPR